MPAISAASLVAFFCMVLNAAGTVITVPAMESEGSCSRR